MSTLLKDYQYVGEVLIKMLVHGWLGFLSLDANNIIFTFFWENITGHLLRINFNGIKHNNW